MKNISLISLMIILLGCGTETPENSSTFASPDCVEYFDGDKDKGKDCRRKGEFVPSERLEMKL